MLFLKSLLYTVFVTCYLVSLDSSVRALRDGSKYAFVQAPHISILQQQKEMMLQEEASITWPNGIVKYHIDVGNVDINKDIRFALNYIEKRSCIKFLELTKKPHYNLTWLHITNPNKERECSHGVSYFDTGEVMVVLGYDCTSFKGILHTLLHGIGMKDEVTHPHRDKYIRVLWYNIHPAYHHLYRKRIADPSKKIVEYDPLSLMHFHDHAYSRNGRPTIAPLEPGLVISPSEDLSQLDQMKLQINFGLECNKRKISNLLDTCKLSLTGQQLNENKKITSDNEDNSGLVQIYGKEDENDRDNSDPKNENQNKESDMEEKELTSENKDDDKKSVSDEASERENANKQKDTEDVNEKKDAEIINEEPEVNHTEKALDNGKLTVKKQLDNDAYYESDKENEIIHTEISNKNLALHNVNDEGDQTDTESSESSEEEE